MREIELKFRIKDPKVIEKKLSGMGCLFSKPLHQRDTVYTKEGSTEEWRSSKEGDITVRIRRQDTGAEFNLKQQRSGESDNLEYETKVDDPETLHHILTVLGYSPEVTVNKMRRKCKLGEYDICLDSVEELGDFLEIEKLAEDNVNPEAVRDELFKAIEPLGLYRTDEEPRGYDTQIFLLHHGK
ncbi:MAG: class IV adenylate cyclase [Patescibacteria group bacterium]|nr:class IV adenylate cyclase [Patescibacteria group bacterium]